eukprot:GHVQ01007055.1.p2 GENE.GHVQ01007055.1~~GHVQ01007055.1.p2  ORF type:complete len:249 (+),score=42.38 GHVQ01007055.1:309-1055(+)
MGNIESNDESRRWVYDNILFLNPDEERKEETQEQVQERMLRCMDKSRVKRFTPSHAKLRNRFFSISFDLQGRRKEFVLKLVNDPDCAVILCDKGGEELKVIPTSKLIYVQRKNQTVDAYFNTARGGKGSKETAVLTFEFEDGIECNAFCDSMKVLFGIPVRSFGLRKVDACVIGEAGTLLTEAEEEDGNSESSSEPVKTRTAKQKKLVECADCYVNCCVIHEDLVGNVVMSFFVAVHWNTSCQLYGLS